MSGDRWQRLQEIFHSAAGLAGELRTAYLEKACAGDEGLREEVEVLLASSVEADVLEDDLRRVASEALEGARRVGTRLGPYRIVRELGQGGMANVYLAQRADDQFQRRVAIKLAYAAQSSQVLSRFRSERQILAGLDHPNIARLLDGGATDDGLPYLVLEYIEGEPIDHYCDSREMGVAERIQVFRAVCDAVYYAHQNLVVHRDLKPSNILVTPEGIPKLLDFGIAKLLRPDLQGQTPVLTTGLHRPMTPEYASPEQIRGEIITTASDVYSLGAVLYELLTGCLPLQFKRPSLGEIERISSEEEPESPSTAALAGVGSGERTPEERARARGITPERLRRALAGDLDKIILMALRKAPARRYVSVFQFSEDLRRYLEGRMVLARRDTIRYRVGKFVRRNRWSVGATAAILALLVGWAVNRAQLARALASERDEALREAKTARRVASFLEDVFRSADPNAKERASLTAREMIDRATIRLDPELADSPELRAELLHTLGNIYRHLGLFSRADSLLQRALAIRRRVLGDNDLLTAQSLVDLGDLRRDQSRYAEGESLLRQGLDIRERRLGPDHLLVAETLHDLGLLLRDEGYYSEAEAVLRRAVALGETQDRGGPELAATLGSLAQVLADEGKPREAEPFARRSVDILRRRPSSHLEIAQSLAGLGDILRSEGALDTAEAVIREALDIERRMLGPDHPAVALNLDELANLLRDRGDLAAAEPLYRESMRIYQARFDDNHLELATVRCDLAELLVKKGRLDEAAHLFQKSLTARQRLGENNPLVLASREGLARVGAARLEATRER